MEKTHKPPESTLDLKDEKPGPRTAYQLYLQDHLFRMRQEIESTTRKLELEKRRLNKLEGDVSRTRLEHSEKVLKCPKTEVKVSTKKLEHRLSKAKATLDDLGHENRAARDNVDQIRRERLQTNQVFKRMQADIKDNVQQVSALQTKTDATRREHEERIHKMNALKKHLESERREFKGTVQKLQKDLKDSSREELQQRITMGKEKGEELADRSRGLKADEEDNFNSTAVMRRILKLAFLNAIQRRHIRQHQKNIEVFEQAFATIKSTTGISDIEEIVKIFVSLEQRNFSLLTYVNTLNREIESFEKRNRELDYQISNAKDLEASSEKKRQDSLAELKQQIQSTTTSTEEDQMQAAQQMEILERCGPIIAQILKVVDKENRSFGGQPATETRSDNVLGWLTHIERALTQWKDFIPDTRDTRHSKSPTRNYWHTVGSQVLSLQPKKPQTQTVPLVKAAELPSAGFTGDTGVGAQLRPPVVHEQDSDSDEEELANHPWTRQELRDKAVATIAKRKKRRKTEGQPNNAATEPALDPPKESETQEVPEMRYEEMVEHRREAEEPSEASEDSGLDEAGPTDEEINEIFLKRYKMSREELQGMADKMGIQLNNLCYLKQEFDAYDEDHSGYIDAKELKELLEKLGEELTDDELDLAFKELDSDASGEIEFFEFVEWFTSEE